MVWVEKIRTLCYDNYLFDELSLIIVLLELSLLLAASSL